MATKRNEARSIISAEGAARRRTTHVKAAQHAESAVQQSSVPAGISEQDQIAKLAYSYWEARGCQGGSPEEDWSRAEREFHSRRETL
jgi:hypothetical protein